MVVGGGAEVRGIREVMGIETWKLVVGLDWVEVRVPLRSRLALKTELVNLVDRAGFETVGFVEL